MANGKRPLVVFFLVAASASIVALFLYTGITHPPASGSEDILLKVPPGTPHIRVGVPTWGGFAGGQYFNEGFDPSTESRYYKNFNILVSFVLMDDIPASREVWKRGDIDVISATADSLAPEIETFLSAEPRVIFQSDWSRGGDAIISDRSIRKPEDLKGKRIAFLPASPSHTLLLHVLDTAKLKYGDVRLVETTSARDAAALFKKGKVDAAVVWSPDDEDCESGARRCVKSVAGSRILSSTAHAPDIIADVFFAKKSYIESHRQELRSLIQGWMIGNAEINESAQARSRAARILSVGMRQPVGFCAEAMNKVRLVTYGDNRIFFGLDKTSTRVTAEDLYTRMAAQYKSLHLAPENTPSWKQIVDPSILSSLTGLTGNQSPEK